ncbi:MAG: MFS transporter [Phycisphaeraceae bacterium]|nr:MFS transporter [Phycisphaeraceae bacterium]
MTRECTLSEVPDPRPASSGRVVTLALMFACHALHLFGFGAIGLFLPLIRKDLGINYTLAGVLSACSALIYAVMQIPAGALVDRFGPRRIFAVGTFGHAVTVLFIGLAPDYLTMAASMLMNGFFRSLVFTPGLIMMSVWFAPERRATAMAGFMSAAFVFSAALMTIGPRVEIWQGWRFFFVTCGALAVVIAAVFGRAASDPPSAPAPTRVAWSEVLGLFRHRFMRIVAGIQFVRLAVVYSLFFWLPTFLVDDVGLSLQASGLIIAIATLLGAPSGLVGGYVSDRTGRPVLVICVALTALTATLSTLALTESVPVIVIAITGTFLFMQCYFGPLFAAPIHILGSRVAGVASGFGNFFANVGAFLCGFLLGVLRDQTGSFASGFVLLAALALIGVVLGLMLEREHAKHAKHADGMQDS